MAVMPALAWEPGGPVAPGHFLSFFRIDHILHQDTDTPYHDHYQHSILTLTLLYRYPHDHILEI